MIESKEKEALGELGACVPHRQRVNVVVKLLREQEVSHGKHVGPQRAPGATAIPGEGQQGREVPAVQQDLGDQEQVRQSAEDRSYRGRGWACPCSEAEGGQGGRGYQHQSCSASDPSSDGRESYQSGNPASG